MTKQETDTHNLACLSTHMDRKGIPLEDRDKLPFGGEEEREVSKLLIENGWKDRSDPNWVSYTIESDLLSANYSWHISSWGLPLIILLDKPKEKGEEADEFYLPLPEHLSKLEVAKIAISTWASMNQYKKS